jgi:hypothetical protein
MLPTLMRPAASMIRPAGTRSRSPTAVMVSPVIPRSARTAAAPVPSTIWPLAILMSPDGQSVAVDATTIDPMGVTLRGIPPGPAWSLTVRRGNDCKVQDLNKDGAPDLVCQFTWQPGPVVSPGLQRAVLTGTTLNGGHDFLSSDTIKFVQ